MQYLILNAQEWQQEMFGRQTRMVCPMAKVKGDVEKLKAGTTSLGQNNEFDKFDKFDVICHEIRQEWPIRPYLLDEKDAGVYTKLML
jgi:hypothetical protein